MEMDRNGLPKHWNGQKCDSALLWSTYVWEWTEMVYLNTGMDRNPTEPLWGLPK